MERAIPRRKLTRIVELVYPKAGNGRRPHPLEKMLRIYCRHLCCNIRDPLIEEQLYDSKTMAAFTGIDLVNGVVDLLPGVPTAPPNSDGTIETD